MIKNFQKILSIAFHYDKKNFYFVVFSSFITINLELLSVASFIPLFQIIISKKISYPLTIFFSETDYNILLYIILILIVLIFIVKNIIIILLEWFIFYYQESIRLKLTLDLFKYYLSNNWLEIIEKSSTEKIRHLDGEVKNCISYIYVFIKLINETVIFSLLIVFLAIINFKILITNIFLLSIFGVVYFLIIKKKLIQVNLDRYNIHRNFLSILQDTFRSLKDIKILQKESNFHKKFDQYSQMYKEVIIKSQVINLLPKSFLEPIIILMLVIVVFSLNDANISNSELIYTLGIYSVILFRLFPSTNRIISQYQQLVGGTPIIDIIYRDYKKILKAINHDKDTQINQITFKHKIEIKNIQFKYRNKTNLLSSVNLDFKKGTSVGIVGPSGSGKSTLINIFLGLISQDNGEILVDGIKINNLSTEWKKIIGFVPQDINLINDSFLNNITLDLNNKFDKDRMDEALNISNLKNFVNTLPDGLNTHLGDFGNKISGGQKQRIGIARAIYKNPSIIILDESTNSLDLNLEKEIINSINEIKHNYSSIIISHRNSTIEKCDHVYKLFDGKLEQIR